MTPTGAARVAGVAGWPIAHSLSPAMMSQWIDYLDIDALYAPFAIAPEHHKDAFRMLSSTGLAGLNVTIPYKQSALEIADDASTAAAAVGAANLLTFEDGRIRADNTDIAGFLYALSCTGLVLGPPTRVVVLGAGGAARAVCYALSLAGVTEANLCNRSGARAEKLAIDLMPSANIVPWDQKDAALSGADLVINATSLGMGGRSDLVLDWRAASPGAVAFDIVYTPLETRFLRDARKAGLQIVDGLGMLIGQARPSFEALFKIASPSELDMRAILEPRLNRPD
jgi:shikimate dehydrogenase